MFLIINMNNRKQNNTLKFREFKNKFNRLLGSKERKTRQFYDCTKAIFKSGKDEEIIALLKNSKPQPIPISINKLNELFKNNADPASVIASLVSQG